MSLVVNNKLNHVKVSCAVMRLLLEYGANPDLLCEGHSALTLAICSGNDLVRYWYLLNMTIHICMCVLHVYITCKCSKFNQNWSYMYSTCSLNNECQFVQFGDLFFVIPIILETFVAVLVLPNSWVSIAVSKMCLMKILLISLTGCRYTSGTWS